MDDATEKADRIIGLFRSEAGLYWEELGEEQQTNVRGMLLAILLDDGLLDGLEDIDK